MRRTMIGLAAVAATLAGGLVADTVTMGSGPPALVAQGPDEDCRPVESERFMFHNDPWINLHHFLFQWARNASPRQPGDRRRTVEVPEQAQLGSLEPGARQAWERAVGFYRERLVEGDLLFDRELVALRGRLGAMACSGGGSEGIDPDLMGVLTHAMPVYREHWWLGHHHSNSTWIQDQVRLLGSYEASLAGRLAEAYGGEWPSERIRVDVTAYSNWAGAYTTNQPNQVTVSSPDYQGLRGLEMLFHEVSHASFLEQRLLGQLAAACQRQGVEPPGRLAHAIQFVTPAEILRSLLTAEEREGLVLVADRMAQRRRLREQYRAVLEHWRPFLEGELDRTEALERIAAELSSKAGPAE